MKRVVSGCCWAFTHTNAIYICSDRARTVSSGSYQHNTRIRMQSSIGFISSFSLCLFYLPYEISFVQSSKMQSIPVTRIAYDLYIGLDSTRIFFVFCSSRNTRRLATPTSTFFIRDCGLRKTAWEKRWKQNRLE